MAPNRFPSLWTSRLGSGPLVLLGFCQLLLLVLPGSLAIRLYMSREDALAMLGSPETRLYFDSCDQSSQRSGCVFAIDSGVSQEPTQCAVTDPEDGPWWQAVLETPAYVSKVTLLNMDHTYRSFQDALTSMVVMAGDEICFRFETGEQFTKRSFPCDALTDAITIKSHREKAVLTICDVEIYGAPLKFPTAKGEDQLLSPNNCLMPTLGVDSPNCDKIFDGKTSTDHTASPCAFTNVQERPWIQILLDRPAIVNQVRIFGRTDVKNEALSKFDITLNEHLCVSHDGALIESFFFNCKHFGDRLRVQSNYEMVALSLCEVQLLGHSAMLDEPQKFKPLGCHKDKLQDHDLTQLVASIKMSHAKCYQMCKRLGLKHFAVQNGLHCFCGSSYGKHGAADNSSCSVVCDAVKDDICGGPLLNSVFEIL